MTRPLVINGSDRLSGNTRKAILSIFAESSIDIIDLIQRDIRYYNYETDPADDFLEVVGKLQSASVIIFATPVYWYAMSGRLKVFFDRLTDLITRHKQIGRSLKGKRVALLATGTDPDLPSGFEVPFDLTSKYFGMNYRGARYYQFRSGEMLATEKHLTWWSELSRMED